MAKVIQIHVIDPVGNRIFDSLDYRRRVEVVGDRLYTGESLRSDYFLAVKCTVGFTHLRVPLVRHLTHSDVMWHGFLVASLNVGRDYCAGSGPVKRIPITLEVTAALLFPLDGLEKRFEIPLSERASPFSLDYFVKKGRSILDGLAEYLKQVSFIVPVHQNSKIL